MKNSQYTFFLLMALASGLSILKTGVLAGLLSADDFAIYVGVFSSVSFVAEIISFGLTHGTFKAYPRYIAHGRYADLKDSIVFTLRALALRHLAFAVLSVTIAAYFYGQKGAIAAASVSFLAIGMNMLSLAGSLFRALGRLFDLGIASAARAAAAAGCGIGFAVLGGWTTAFLTESLSSMLIGLGLISALYVHIGGLISEHGNGSVPDTPTSQRGDGVTLFVAYLLLTVPVSLDRLVLAKIGDPGAVSTYAFVGIWLTAAYTLSGIFVQKFGPELVSQLTLAPHTRPLKAARKNALFLSLLLGTGTALTMVCLRLFLYETMWLKYGLSGSAMAIAVFAVGLQITPVFEWTLIALDGEKFVLTGAALLSFVMVVMFLLAFWIDTGFVGYASAIVIARLSQIVLLDRSIASLQRSRTLSLARETA